MRSKTKIYPLAAAICYTVFGVYIAVELVGSNFRCGYYFAAFWDTLFFCGLIGLAAAHVFRSKKAAIAAAGAAALINMPAANITIAFRFILNFILFISYYFMYLSFTQKSAAFIFHTLCQFLPLSSPAACSIVFPKI